jgi:hypothetical protein
MSLFFVNDGNSSSRPALLADYFHNLYFVSGAFVVVTSTPSDFPQQGVGYILSGAPRPDDGGMDSVIAGPDRWRMVTPEQAEGLLGGVAVKKTGISVSRYPGNVGA